VEHFQLSDESLVASLHLSWLALELSRTRVTKRGNFVQRCELAEARGAQRRLNARCENPGEGEGEGEGEVGAELARALAFIDGEG
jgi:hypothetical protein